MSFAFPAIALAPEEQQPTHSCTEIACTNGVTVTLPQAQFSVAGDYHFQVILDDGKHATCRGRLPFSSCKDAVVCEGPIKLDIDQAGCMLPPAQHFFGALRLEGQTPVQLHVFIARDDVTLVDQTLRPSFETSTPNGPQCPPICRAATVLPDLSAQ